MISKKDPGIQKYLTPYKYEKPLLWGSGIPGAFDELAVDIPFVFRHQNHYFMMYVGFDGIGYQTALAISEDLLHWKPYEVILKREEGSGRWDEIGAAGTWIIKEDDSFETTPRLKKIDGKYWLVYHSYPGSGYETGPAEISLAWCEEDDLRHWKRLDAPVFSWRDGENWEKGGLYKACIIRAEDRWVLFYNAKNQDACWIEQTGMAVSEDLFHWERCPQNPVVRVDPGRWDRQFVSDPCVLRDGKVWLDYYFGLGPGHAQEGLAISTDLIHWEKIDGPIVEHGPGESNDSIHAHKASIFYENGRLYHFYCGTRPWREGDPANNGGEFRTIMVASNHPFLE